MANVAIIALLSLLSGVVAFLISYYSYKNNRLVGSILLRYISVGFLILGVSLVLQAGTERVVGLTPVEAFRTRGLEFLAFLLYNALQLIAYGIFAWGYGLSAFVRKQAPAGAAVPSLILSSPGKYLASALLTLAIYVASQIGVVVLLMIIVAQGVRVFSHSRSNLALMVLFGFALIFGGHLLMLAGVLASGGVVFLIGTVVEFCGFLGLLFFLVWSGRVVK